MEVLAVGYGKIGRTKAFLWKSLGATVYIYDTCKAAESRAIEDGFKTYESSKLTSDIIVDISTPAGEHYKALKWCLDSFSGTPRYILIEKPLVSSVNEFESLKNLIDSPKHAGLDKHIFLNESYYASKGLRKLLDIIDGKPTSIEIELSKNRLPDLRNGRFFDGDLWTIGIEVPHMLAILQSLQVPIDILSETRPKLYIDPKQNENQGLELKFSVNSTIIIIKSFLGNFNFAEGNNKKENSLLRTVTVRTDTQNLKLELDPINNLPRYHSRIKTTSLKDGKINIIEIPDNHMLAHMLKFKNDDHEETMLGYNNASYLSKLLLKLRENCQIIDIDNINLAQQITLPEEANYVS